MSASFIKTTYDISLDSQISLLPLGFSLLPENPQGNQEIDQGIEEEMSVDLSVDYVLPLEVSSPAAGLTFGQVNSRLQKVRL